MLLRLLRLLISGTIALCAFADSKTYSWTDCPSIAITESQAGLFFDAPAGSLKRDQAGVFYQSVSGTALTDSDYVIFHVLRWKTESDASKPQTVEKQNWYVFHRGDWSDEDFSQRKRVYGARTVTLIYAHLNRRQNFNYSATYNLEVTKKTPVFLVHLGQVGQLFLSKAPGGGGNVAGYAGSHRFVFDYIPSDLKFTPVFDLLAATCLAAERDSAQPSGGPPIPHAPAIGFAPEPQPSDNRSRSGERHPPSQPGAVGQANRPAGIGNTGFETVPPEPVSLMKTGTQVSDLKSEVFDNEGRYFFDFSVGVPITKIRDVKFTSGSTDTLTATKTDTQNLFAFFNLYFRPVDTKRNTLLKLPYLVTGPKVGSQPLKKWVIAGAWGPAFANFYVGVLLNTRSLSSTATCENPTAPLLAGTRSHNKTCAEFTFGINLPIGALAAATRK